MGFLARDGRVWSSRHPRRAGFALEQFERALYGGNVAPMFGGIIPKQADCLRERISRMAEGSVVSCFDLRVYVRVDLSCRYARPSFASWVFA